MIFRTLIFAIALTSPVFAAPVSGTATLAAAASKAKLVTDAGSWTCTGTSCTGTSDTVTSNAVAVCTGVADRAGRVTAFASGETVFADAELARCNRHLK